MPNMLTMRELAEASDDPDEPVITVVDQNDKAVARHFEDATTFFPMLGGWEVWQLINLSGDTHPIHLHLEPFYVLGRRPITVTVPDNGIGDRSTTATVRLAPDPDDELDHAVDANEGGLKDTVRVNPNEIVELAVRFQRLHRPLHVPLPPPRTRGPRHDAPDRHHARRAHAVHDLTPPHGPGDTGRAFRPPRRGTRRARALAPRPPAARQPPATMPTEVRLPWLRTPAGVQSRHRANRP